MTAYRTKMAALALLCLSVAFMWATDIAAVLDHRQPLATGSLWLLVDGAAAAFAHQSVLAVHDKEHARRKEAAKQDHQ